MNKVNIGIDVDLTTLASDRAWWYWLWNMSMQPGTIDNCIPTFETLRDSGQLTYYLPDAFPSMLNENVDPLDFWRNEGVYDTIQPVDGAVECITHLMKRNDVEVTFVTHNKGNGGRSKYNCLARLFGKGNFNMIVTREKHLVNMHCLIDDRMNFLNPCYSYGIAPFFFETSYAQDTKQNVPVVLCKGWYDAHEKIERWIDMGYPTDPTWICNKRGRKSV